MSAGAEGSGLAQGLPVPVFQPFSQQSKRLPMFRRQPAQGFPVIDSVEGQGVYLAPRVKDYHCQPASRLGPTCLAWLRHAGQA